MLVVIVTTRMIAAYSCAYDVNNLIFEFIFIILIVIFHPPAADRSRDSPGELAPIVRGWNIVSTFMKEDHPESSVEKKNIKRHLQAWDMLCLALSMTTKDISVCWDSKKKVQTQQTGEKFLISLWLYISDFGEPNFCEPSLSVRRWWLEVWWRVRKPWDQKQLILGCTVEGPDLTGEVVEGFREQRWFDWIVCLGQKEVISLWYIWIWVPMWYIWIWVSDV